MSELNVDMKNTSRTFLLADILFHRRHRSECKYEQKWTLIEYLFGNTSMMLNDGQGLNVFVLLQWSEM